MGFKLNGRSKLKEPCFFSFIIFFVELDTGDSFENLK
jgi:hypothetical protein